MTQETGSVPLRVATYNVRCPCDAPPNDWQSRAPRVAGTLSRYRFDIFGAQEVVDCQIESISKGSGYNWIGTGREKDLNGEYSCVFYSPERIENLGQHTFWLSETPSMPGRRSWDSACNRICTYGIFRDRISDRKFVFANTHLDHVGKLAMSNGIKVILEHLAGYFPAYPVIVTGDFNSYPDTEPVKIISAKMSNARLISETPHAGPPKETYHGYKPDPKDRNNKAPIDYIFVSEGIKVLRHEAVDDFEDGLASSDHFAVFADVRM